MSLQWHNNIGDGSLMMICTWLHGMMYKELLRLTRRGNS